MVFRKEMTKEGPEVEEALEVEEVPVIEQVPIVDAPIIGVLDVEDPPVGKENPIRPIAL